MKARIAPNRVLGLSLLASVLAGSTISSAQTPTASVPAKPASVARPVFKGAVPAISSALADFLKNTQPESNENTLLSCVKANPGIFALGADQIIYLQRQGFSSRVIIAMLEHDADMLSRGKPPVFSPVVPEQKAAALTFSKRPASPEQKNQVSAALENATGKATSAKDSSAATPEETLQQPGDFEDPGLSADYEDAVEDVQDELYPVRRPYAVKLSDPIIVFRAPPVEPNLVVIHRLP